MKQYFPISIFLLVVAIFSPFNFAMADSGTFSEGVQWAIDFLQGAVVPLLLALGLVYFLWGVVKYVTAGGNEDKMKEGRSLVVYGIIALFVMISVFGLVRILTNTFGFDFVVPQLEGGSSIRSNSSNFSFPTNNTNNTQNNLYSSGAPSADPFRQSQTNRTGSGLTVVTQTDSSGGNNQNTSEANAEETLPPEGDDDSAYFFDNDDDGFLYGFLQDFDQSDVHYCAPEGTYCGSMKGIFGSTKASTASNLSSGVGSLSRIGSNSNTLNKFSADSVYTKGISTLHDKSLNQRNEYLSFFVIDGTGKESWTSPKEMSASSGFISYKYIDSLISKGAKEIFIDHSHPKAMGLDSNPPSFQDLSSLMNIQNRYKGSGVIIHFQVTDPSGVWDYSLGSPGNNLLALQKVYGDLANLDDLLNPAHQKALSNPSYKSIYGNIDGLDPRAKVIKLVQASEDDYYGSSIKSQTDTYLDNIKKIMATNPDAANIDQLEGSLNGNLSKDKQAQIIQNYVSSLRNEGVTINYTPYNNP